jgi:hypothetical protein
MTEPPRRHPSGFTLPVVMVVAAALLVLAVGLLALSGIERRTALSFSDAKRAELAARAGLEEFRALLRAETANDDFLIIAGDTPPADPPPAPLLYLVRGEGGGTPRFRHLPLFSSRTLPEPSTTLKIPAPEPTHDLTTRIDGPPGFADIRVEWLPVLDESGRTVARYAYWVEDLQGKIDARRAGNREGPDGSHWRDAWPIPSAGHEPPAPRPDPVALHVLDPAANEDGDGALLAKVAAGRERMLSPDSLLAATGHAAPIARDPQGRPLDPVAAALESSACPVIQPYEEVATVPFAPGISAAAAGKPKLDLNTLLARPRATAIDDFAEWIDRALPDFRQRQGGFPEDYLRTLAANALDYADADTEPTVAAGSHRGLDGQPLVSEFLMSFRWDDVVREDGITYAVFTVGTFVELWNLSDQPVEGEVQVSFETKFDFPLGANPSVSFEEAAADPAVASPVAIREDGYLWHPPQTVRLQPNEVRVIPFRIRLKVDAGAGTYLASPLQVFSGNYDGNSGYRLRWNGRVVDQSRAQTWKVGGSLNYPKNTKKDPRQFVRATVPALSHAAVPSNFGPYQNNPGDPRMSYYLGTRQARNDYPDNYSPHRRNIRWGTIYQGDQPHKPKPHGRVLPSEWPDGGHDAPHGPRPAIPADDARLDPDDPSLLTGLPAPRRELAPMRISNLGRFTRATELGRCYDPVMWQTAGQSPAVPWPDIAESAAPSPNYGGGNTLRIGRAEHPRFAKPGLHAAHLLDLFHAGDEPAADSPRVKIHGHINLNTANADALRALAAGTLRQDPLLALTTSTDHETDALMARPTAPLELGAPRRDRVADRIAEALLHSRPFACAAEIAAATDGDGLPVFGNRAVYPDGDSIQWTDSAAEEVFARVHDSATLRSRNFRIWIIGQALAPVVGERPPEVLAESRKVFTVFAEPARRDDGSIDPARYRPRVIHENAF